MPLFDSMTSALSRVLDLRQQQHAITASNLANADTPGFKARVLEFDDTLTAVMEHAKQLQLHRQVGDHLGSQAVRDPRIVQFDPTPWTVDDNSVLPEREMARMQENALLYRAVSEGLSRRLALLKYAANDGR